jgi:hypothetical protein
VVPKPETSNSQITARLSNGVLDKSLFPSSVERFTGKTGIDQGTGFSALWCNHRKAPQKSSETYSVEVSFFKPSHDENFPLRACIGPPRVVY